MTCSKIIQILILLSGASALCSLNFGHASKSFHLIETIKMTLDPLQEIPRSNKCHFRELTIKNPAWSSMTFFHSLESQMHRTQWRISKPQGMAPNKSISSWIIEDESPENLHSRKTNWYLWLRSNIQHHTATVINIKNNNSQIQTFQVNVHNRPHKPYCL